MHIAGKHLEHNPKKWKYKAGQCMYEALILSGIKREAGEKH